MTLITPPTPGAALRREWVWAVLASLVVASLASTPYLVGYLSQTDSARYAWVSVAPEDNLSYFAKIGQGERGSWLFRLPYSAHPNKGAPINLYYLLLGHVAHWFGLGAPAIFHLARYTNSVLVLLAAYACLTRLSSAAAERRFMFGLVALSSGLGWLMLPLERYLSSDLTMPESNTFLSMMDTAHFPLSQALLLAFAVVASSPPAATRPGQWGLALAAALSLAAQALLQPFVIAVMFGTLGVFGLVRWWQDKRFPTYLALRTGAGVLITSGLVWTTSQAIANDPLLAGWSGQNLALSPPIWDFLTGYGLLLIPAAFGAVWAARQRQPAYLWVVAWLVVTVIGLYSPTPLQRRLSQGLHLPIAFLAGLGVCRVWLPRFPLARRWLVTRLVLVATLPTTLLVILLFSGGAATHNPKLFLLNGEDQALAWLRSEASADGVVLSSWDLGAFIPAFTSQRAVSGHAMETLNAVDTEARVAQFYTAGTSAAERRAALAEWGVRYVLLGPRERQLGVDYLTAADGVIAVATFDQVTVYQVQLE